MTNENKIKKIVKFCKKKNWEVVFGLGIYDQCYPEGDPKDGKKRIYINSKNSQEIQLFSLMHEAGHMIGMQNQTWFKQKYPGYNFKENSVAHRITILEEEIDAWSRGLSLAKKLKLKINKNKYLKLKTKCLHMYIKELFQN